MSKAGFNRKDPRFATNLVALIRLQGRFAWKQASVVNLSAGGVGLRTKAEFAKGDLVEMEINTVDKDGQPRKRRVRGQVAWTRLQQVGIMFTGNSKEANTPGPATKPPAKKTKSTK